MEGTRVFVSGLPPKLTNEELRKHFSRFHVTDAHIIPHRRIGFVGFKDAGIAKQAVDYFNKTYIRMSKIRVDIARPPNADTTQTESGKQSQDRTSSDTSLKRKRPEDPKQDAKLEEFLSVMQRPSKTRTWANDDDLAQNLILNQKPQENLPEIEESQTEGPRKKRKVEDANKTSAGPSPQERFVEQKSKSSVESNRDVEVDEAPAGDTSSVNRQTPPPQSDEDWLRSKTSRLLGLLDEEEEEEERNRPRITEINEEDEADEPMRRDSKDAANSTESHGEDSGQDQSSDERDYNADIEQIRNFGRLFIRNLPYDATEADLQPIFSRFGKVDEIHIAFDTRHETSKGFAYVQYVEPSSAIEAYKSLDGKDFQGRLLHVLPATAKKTYKISEAELAKLPVKKQRQIKRKLEASSSTFNWNSLYMNADAVMSSVAERLGVSKADLLDPTSSDAAVKQAHAETHVIQETKAYFSAHGVNLESFKQRERGNTAILVKNFSYGVKSSDLKKMFERYGEVTRLLMPPSGTIAIVEFAHPDEAQRAFKSLAYRKLGDSVLFLERAPKDLFNAPAEDKTVTAETQTTVKSQGFSATDTFAAPEDPSETQTTPTATLFVRNLNFSTTSARLAEVFKPLEGFLSATVRTKPNPKRPGERLSMGFGFVEFRTKAQAQAALAAMDGYTLDQHQLVVKMSHKGMDAAEERRREDIAKKTAAKRTKIIIKNLPFQATKKEVRALFSAYGKLRSVRVPKKFDRTSRGFAFADFVSAREAENAMDALKNTHFLGRKLVLEYAAEDAIDPEEEIQKIEKKMGQQVDRVKIQNMTRSERKKFVVGEENEDQM